MEEKTEYELIADHITPKALGGSDELSNVQLLCKLCNQKKTIEDVRRIMIIRRKNLPKKHRTNLTINPVLLEGIEKMGINVSQFVEQKLMESFRVCPFCKSNLSNMEEK